MKYSFKLGAQLSQNPADLDINNILNLSPPELTEKLNSQIGALEGIDYLGQIYTGIYIVKVKSVQPHPDADKLQVVKIDDGGAMLGLARDENDLIQIVCGAPNVRAQMLAVWIAPGAVVPATASDAEPFKLSSLKLRGVTSNGMLASPKELNLSDDHSGIVDVEEVLGLNQNQGEATSLIGKTYSEVFELDDVIADFENKMFTHRPDCFGHLGIAREISAIEGLKFKSPDWYALGSEQEILNQVQDDKSDTKLKVNIQTKACPAYRATIIEDVQVGASPQWMQTTFRSLETSPINNLVDITNYMMILTAQPQHAFDLDKLKKLGNLNNSDELEIIIRNAHEGEELALLNGKTIKLSVEDIVIATPQKAIALAGVMGGSETEVDDNTKNVLLETATFDMYTVRRTSMRHGLFTDAVTRYTKGQPAAQIDAVAAKSGEMYKDLAGGKISLSLRDNFGAPSPLKGGAGAQVNLSLAKLNSVLGLELKLSEVEEILSRVEIKLNKISDDTLEITPPFWRTDLEIPEDIIEEVGRIYGFNKIPAELQTRQIQPARTNPSIKLKSEIRNYLARLGANETLNYSFVHGKLLAAAGQNLDLAFKIRNALSPDLQYYRLSLTPSLLGQIHKNIKDGFDAFSLFEIGKVHIKNHFDELEDSIPAEMPRLSLVVANKDGSPADAYYLAKKYLTELLNHLQIKFSLVRTDPEFFGDKIPVTAPFSQINSATIFIDEKPAGIIGNINPQTALKLKLPSGAAAVEMDLHGLLDKFNTDPIYKPIGKFPSVHQDVTVEVPAGAIYSAVERKVARILSSSKFKFSVHPVSIYQADAASATKKITFALELSHAERTLQKAEVNQLVMSLIAEIN